MARSRRRPAKTWVFDPAGAFRRSHKRVPPDVQQEVQRRAQELIDSTLKHRHIQPAPEKPQFNYLVDIYSRWRGPFFYFCSKYCCPGAGCLSPFFESGFARLQYAGDVRFNLAYFRHTGQWQEVAQMLSLDECLSWIEEGTVFAP